MNNRMRNQLKAMKLEPKILCALWPEDGGPRKVIFLTRKEVERAAEKYGDRLVVFGGGLWYV